MMSYRSNNRNKFGGRRDAKELSRQRKEIVAIDSDICGRVDLEDDEGEPIRQPRVRHSEVTIIRNNINVRHGNQILAGAAGKTTRTILCTLVTVRYAASSGLKHVLQSIEKFLETFRPIAPRINETDIEFYIVDDQEAEAIKSLSRRIPDKRNRNNRYIIHTRKAPATWNALDKQIRDVMTTVVAKRFNRLDNSLDLSDFSSDKDFTSKKIICSLSRNEVMVALCDIIEKEYSNITQLSLRDNRLRALIFLSSLMFRCKNIKVLDLSSNELKNIEDLDRISLWNIEKLLLENNPFCLNYTDADVYTRDIHKYLPTVTYLDGIHVAPSAVGIEITRSSLLPKPRLSYCDSEPVRKMIEKFLQEFITLYDNPEPETARKQLIAAYHETAEFTYSINTLDNHTSSRGDIETWSAYLRGSRNICFEDAWSTNPDRVRYKGAMEIAVQLAKLPSTKHLVETFLLDVGFFAGDLCGFTLRGLFIDGSEAEVPRPHYKLFMRNFLVMSTGEGTMAILCDTLQISPIAPTSADDYRDMLTTATLESNNLAGPSSLSQPANADISGNVPSIVVTAPPPTPQPLDANMKRQMIERFSAETKMNLAYSERCLEDNHFDFVAAGRRFVEIRDQIPPAAFE